MSASTRDMIREFNVAFDRPVNESWAKLTVSERELLGKLLLEETLEYCEKGLGLQLMIDGISLRKHYEQLTLEHVEGALLDPAECIDGLADVNVVIHFCAHWHGFNLDKATSIVNDANMSKLGSDGKPIINGVTPGYQQFDENWPPSFAAESGYDPSKPIGKILKGPNFYEPQPLLMAALNHGELNNG